MAVATLAELLRKRSGGSPKSARTGLSSGRKVTKRPRGSKLGTRKLTASDTLNRMSMY